VEKKCFRRSTMKIVIVFLTIPVFYTCVLGAGLTGSSRMLFLPAFKTGFEMFKERFHGFKKKKKLQVLAQ
jgi:hypothetical protein